jgi:hypothetical protein
VIVDTPLKRNLIAGNQYTSSICEFATLDAGIRKANIEAGVCVLLNAIRHPSTRYPRRNIATLPARYSLLRWGNRAVAGSVDKLLAAGYLAGEKGYRVIAEDEGLQSTFQPTPKLSSLIDLEKIEINEVPPELIHLTTKEGKETIRVEYSDTDQTQKWREEVETLNDHNAIFDFRLFDAPLDVRLYRVFNRKEGFPDFSPEAGGGRCYSIALNTPKKLRHGITIDGETVGIVDVKSFHLYIAYTLAGIDYLELHPKNPDPYTIRPDTTPVERDVNKLLVLCGMNATSRRNAVEAVRGKVKRFVVKGKLDGSAMDIDLYQNYDSFLAYHAPIRRYMNAGLGTQFHYLDSKFLMEVMLRLVGRNIPFIGIHDAILTQIRHVETVSAIMESVYLNQYDKRILLETSHPKRRREKKREGEGEREGGEERERDYSSSMGDGFARIAGTHPNEKQGRQMQHSRDGNCNKAETVLKSDVIRSRPLIKKQDYSLENKVLWLRESLKKKKVRVLGKLPPKSTFKNGHFGRSGKVALISKVRSAA